MAPDAVEIRPFQPANGEAVAAMLSQVYGEQAALKQVPEGSAEFRAYAAATAIADRARTHQAYVAWQGVRPVGIIETRSDGLVTLLFVKGSYGNDPAGYGIALGLMARAEEACRAAGLPVMTASASPAAQAFYQRLGFVPAGELQQAEGLAFVIMEKRL